MALEAKSILWGREQELKQLESLRKRAAPALVVLSGRRRIGKSTLMQRFGKRAARFVEFQGLAPREGIGPKEQLANFAEQFRVVFNLPALLFQDWTEAFAHLATQTAKGEVVILLDEISWMGSGEPDFAGKLKIAWDTRFKNNPKLILALCGSVSSWIERNILRDADFVGRVSLVLRLDELPLASCAQLLTQRKNALSNFEIFKILCITGGIPKYLEEINPRESAEQNIARLCFTRGGYLYEDFERIFNDIFDRRSPSYKKIVSCLTLGHLAPLEIAKKLKVPLNSDLSAALTDLEQSGFLARDFVYSADGKRSRHSRYRIRDNYLRFYLRYIAPVYDKIKKGLFDAPTFDTMLQWSTIRGLQFENVVMNNLPSILRALGINITKLVSASPYFQNKTVRSEACQIDLLIALKHQSMYVAEIKFRETIGVEVIAEVQEKIRKLKRPRYTSVRPVLIYAGTLSRELIDADYFDTMLNVEQLILSVTAPNSSSSRAP